MNCLSTSVSMASALMTLVLEPKLKPLMAPLA